LLKFLIEFLPHFTASPTFAESPLVLGIGKV